MVTGVTDPISPTAGANAEAPAIDTSAEGWDQKGGANSDMKGKNKSLHAALTKANQELEALKSSSLTTDQVESLIQEKVNLARMEERTISQHGEEIRETVKGKLESGISYEDSLKIATYGEQSPTIDSSSALNISGFVSKNATQQKSLKEMTDVELTQQAEKELSLIGL